MAQKVLSVYIGENKIRVVEISRGVAHKLIVHQAIDVATPPGCVQDGLITNIEQVAEQLKYCIKEMHTKVKSVIFTVSSKKLSCKEADVPFIKQKEKINEILSANSQDYFPMIHPENYVYSHTLLQNMQAEGGMKHKRIMAVAIPKVIIEAYYALAQKVGLRIETIDYAGNSILQLMKRNLSDANHLLVQIEEEFSYVSIVVNGVVVLQRSISYGIKTAVAALAQLRGITEEQALLVLKEQPESVQDSEYEEVTYMLLHNIARFLDFYISRNGTLEILCTHLFSTSDFCLQIAPILQKEMGGEVVYVEKMNEVVCDTVLPISNSRLFCYMSCIGAVCHPMGFVLSAEVSQEEKAARNKKNVLRVFFASVGIAVVAVLFSVSFYFAVQNEKKELMQQLADMQAVREAEAAFQQVQSEYDALSDFYKVTQNDNEKLYEFILDLEEVMPESVGFTGLQANSGAITISGTSRGKEAIAELILQLKALSYIDHVFVTNMSETYDEFDVPTTTFALTCDMNGKEKTEETKEVEE